MLSLLQKELVKAMKAKKKETILCLRNIIGKIKLKQIDKGDDLDEKECIQILISSAKQLKESIVQYKGGGRNDLAQREEFELQLIETFLPKQLTEDNIRSQVKKIILTINASSITDMGRVMGAAMNELTGFADGNIVKKIVQEELNS